MCLVSSLSSYWALNSLKGVIRGTGEISSGGLVSFGENATYTNVTVVVSVGIDDIHDILLP